MQSRINIYFKEDTYTKFSKIQEYLSELNGPLHHQGKKNSATAVILIEVFYKLFLETGNSKNYYERLSQLEKNLQDSEENTELKTVRRQIDQLLYLELTNFHALTKGADFDVQDLESVHSKFDPVQHELLARIDELIQEDRARGQTKKYSH